MHFSFFALRQCLLVAALSTCAALMLSQASLASIIVYTASMSGPNESPANASPGVGTATVTIDTTLNTMRVQATFSGLTGNTTAAHIHAATAVPFVGTAGVATQTPSFTGFPLGVTSGNMDTTFDMTLASSFNAAFITGNGGTTTSATNALFASMASGTSYFNIHSSTFGGGEIRGFLTAVPEPSSMMLSGLAVVGLAIGYRRRRAASKRSSDASMAN